MKIFVLRSTYSWFLSNNDNSAIRLNAEVCFEIKAFVFLLILCIENNIGDIFMGTNSIFKDLFRFVLIFLRSLSPGAIQIHIVVVNLAEEIMFQLAMANISSS